MDKRYQVIQRCSELLQCSNVKQLDKLSLELKFIQIKRLLLRGPENGGHHQQINQGAFDELEALIREVNESAPLGPALDRVSQRLDEMIEVLWAIDKIYGSYSGLVYLNNHSAY